MTPIEWILFGEVLVLLIATVALMRSIFKRF